MSTVSHAMSYAVADSTTMLRRNLRHQLRNPTLILFIIGIPVVFLLVFVYVFGGTLGAGLGSGVSSGSGSRQDYANYLVPGILVLTIAGGGQGTAISIAMDMTEGIIARFKTMNISRVSVLTGHVLGTLLQTAIALVVVLGVGLLVGFRADANPVEWVAALGLLLLIGLALTWLCVALGLAAKSVETASNTPMPLLLLPFLGSGFAPTDQMPGPRALVRRAPAVHPLHRDASGAPARRRDRQRRDRQPRLVCRHHRRQLPVCEVALQPGPLPLGPGGRRARRGRRSGSTPGSRSGGTRGRGDRRRRRGRPRPDGGRPGRRRTARRPARPGGRRPGTGRTSRTARGPGASRSGAPRR